MIPDPYRGARHERKPDGVIVIDGTERAHTLRCVHCGGHFVSMAGSGNKRGYCMKCGGVTCGSKACAKCLHWMKQIEAIERRATMESRLMNHG